MAGAEAAGALLVDAFAAAQRATLEVPDQELGANDLSPSTTMVVALTRPGLSSWAASATVGPIC